jgi:predicted AAA+ superfamily ATPase
VDKIVGRQNEKKILEKLLLSEKAEFLAVYGRRRIGKTFLVHQFFKNTCVYFEVTGSKGASKKEQLTDFHREFVALFKPEAQYTIPKDWSEAFHRLKEEISLIRPSQKIVLFFDELPWLSSPKSGFLRALEYFWNRHASRMPNVIVIICGSAASWMIKKVINNKGGLYGRLSAEIRLQPFSLGEVEEYFQENRILLTKKQIVEIFMATGGVAKYLNFVERGKSSAQNINALCFTPQSPLLKEFHKLYDSLFHEAHRHVEIVRELANKRQGMTQSELAKSIGIRKSGRFGDLLEELEESGFVIGFHSYGKQQREKKFRLIDEYSLFYLTWIDNAKQNLLQGMDKDYWGKIQQSSTWHTWAGYAFENICLKHVVKIKEGLEIAGVNTSQSYWQFLPSKGSSDPGAEIDLVIDRADQCINLCEMKFYNAAYLMTKEDANNLERKKAVFQEKTQTRKALFITLITPYGAKENEYYTSSVDNQLTLECLF